MLTESALNEARKFTKDPARSAGHQVALPRTARPTLREGVNRAAAAVIDTTPSRVTHPSVPGAVRRGGADSDVGVLPGALTSGPGRREGREPLRLEPRVRNRDETAPARGRTGAALTDVSARRAGLRVPMDRRLGASTPYRPAEARSEQTSSVSVKIASPAKARLSSALRPAASLPAPHASRTTTGM
jgi:hypothetical protein